MRQLLVAFVAAAALVASQNSAQAVFEKVLIDNFTDPGTPIHTSSPGSGADGSGTRASGGASGSIYPPAGTLSATTTDIASDRGLSAQSPIVQPNLTAGMGTLRIEGLGAGDAVGIDWNVGGYDFTLNPVIALLDITNSLASAASLQISLWQDGLMTDQIILAIGGLQTTNAFLNASLIDTDTTFVGLHIQNVGDSAFQGNIDRVVANPEPATMALMGLGVLGGAIGYRRRRKDDEVTPVEA